MNIRTKSCQNCGKEYAPSSANFKKSKYCSRACFLQAQTTRIAKTCEQCGQSFEAIQSFKDRRFCSTTCAGLHKITRVTCICQTCGKSFEVVAARAKTARHCSKQCQAAKVEMTCQYCGGKFFDKPSHVHLRQTCSRRCLALLKEQQGKSAIRGRVLNESERQRIGQSVHQYYQEHPEEHNWYVDGAYVDGAQKRGPSWDTQRDLARARDNYTCRNCGKTEEDLGQQVSVHHRVRYRTFASSEEANRLENLICLCQSCHIKIEHKPELLDKIS